MHGILPLAIALATAASAQDGAQPPAGFDAHGFQLAAHDADIRDGLVVTRPGPFVQGDVFFSVLGEYAKAPLVLVASPEGGGDDVETPILDNVVAMNLSAGVALHDRIRIDAKAPVYAFSTGFDTAQQPPAMGDVRASAMVLALRPRHVVGGGGAGLGIVAHVDIPSGTPDQFLGQGAVAGGARLAATYEFPIVTLSADVGTQFNPSLDGMENLNGSDALVANVGLGLLASDTVGFAFELATMPPFVPPERLSFPAEGLASLRYRDPGGFYLTMGSAAGVTSGPGVAAYRVLFGIGYAKQEPAARDFDVIGRLAATDACPTEAETANGWKDDDGCPDKLGAPR